MVLKLLLVLGIVALFLCGTFVVAYIPFYQEDNSEVKEFKVAINALAIKHDLQNGVTEDAIKTKLKYFYPD